jgi:cyclophilin family peptidyl-prolyl cis-trans isomerase/HEAT repeat protein
MRRAAAFAFLLAACAARSAPQAAPASAPDDEVVEIVRLEGKREGGARLLELAAHGRTPSVRARAILALGRQGDEAKVATIAAWLGDSEASVRAASAEALGLIGAASAAPALVAALEAAPSETLAAALGHVGADAASAQALTTLLSSQDATVRAAGARALGSFGHRKQGISEATLAALVHAAGDLDEEVRYAVAYALFRARGDATLPDVAIAALEALAAHGTSAETRAMAVRGLAAHKAESLVYWASLRVGEWRMRVQAVRALASLNGDTRSALAAWVTQELGGNASLWNDPGAHAVLEALTLLAPFANEPGVRPLFATRIGPGAPNLARSTAECLIETGRVRLGLARAEDVLDIGEKRKWLYPPRSRALLVAGLIEEKKWIATDVALLLLQGPLLRAAPDAVAEAAVAFLPDARAERIVTDGLRGGVPMIVGSIADALGAKDAPAASDAILQGAADALAVAKDPEVATSLVHALCLTPERASAYTAALRTAHSNPSAVVRAAAQECLTKVLGQDPGPGVASAAEPRTPADPTRLLGKRVTWTVRTTQGTFVVALDPDLAPWNVGTITALAEKGFYNGTLWHRVVPDFVVQGGDPTGTGWGGPGYSVPAEASQKRYLRGTVGIADAGKDTGGSQWFVMHSAAPHLEQRYTIVGEVKTGMEVVDRLEVGDRIVGIDVKIERAERAP